MFPEDELVQSEQLGFLSPPLWPAGAEELLGSDANDSINARLSLKQKAVFSLFFFFLLCPLLATLTSTLLPPIHPTPLYSTWTCVTSGDVLQIFMIGPEMWR